MVLYILHHDGYYKKSQNKAVCGSQKEAGAGAEANAVRHWASILVEDALRAISSELPSGVEEFGGRGSGGKMGRKEGNSGLGKVQG